MTPEDYAAIREILTTGAIMFVLGAPIAVLLPVALIKTLDKRYKRRRQQEGQ